MSTGIDSNGNVYVADSRNYRIQKFDLEGRFLLKWGKVPTLPAIVGELYPSDIAFDNNDNVWVVDARNRVHKFDGAGNAISAWGSYGSAKGQFNYSPAIVVDSEGALYVVDNQNNRIQKFDNAGNFILKWGTQGTGDGQFSYPTDIAIDRSDTLYVMDNGNHRIQTFDNTGHYLGQWDVLRNGNVPFTSSHGIAVDKLGDVYMINPDKYWSRKYSV